MKAALTGCVTALLTAWAAEVPATTVQRCQSVDGSWLFLPVRPPAHVQEALRNCEPLATAPATGAEALELRLAPRAWQLMTAVRTAPRTPPPPEPAMWHALVAEVAQRHGFEAALLHAVIRVESAYDPAARSPKGALGLMQVMPATGARFGAVYPSQLLDPAVNVDVGARYLRWLSSRFGDRLDLVLAAYNAGEGAVKRYGNRVPPYPETEAYVRRVTSVLAEARP